MPGLGTSMAMCRSPSCSLSHATPNSSVENTTPSRNARTLVRFADHRRRDHFVVLEEFRVTEAVFDVVLAVLLALRAGHGGHRGGRHQVAGAAARLRRDLLR